MATRIPPRVQGDCGEFSAIGWLIAHGARVFLPFEHSPDVDLVADFGDRLVRVQVKTSTVHTHDRFQSCWSRAAETKAGAAG
jgi:Holliday junction resolvase-like predicted endonuclease